MIFEDATMDPLKNVQRIEAAQFFCTTPIQEINEMRRMDVASKRLLALSVLLLLISAVMYSKQDAIKFF